jgi:transcriptional regulator with XRE-family HTH domain
MRKLIGARLEEERDRLGKKKGEMAAIGGVAASAYTNYLEGNRAPDAEFLASIAEAGADVQYILTGVRSISLACKPETKEQHLYAVKAAAELAQGSGLPEKQAADLMDIAYHLGTRQFATVLEDPPGYAVLRPDQKALLDNLEHCSKEDQDVIKRMALLAAKADKKEGTNG